MLGGRGREDLPGQDEAGAFISTHQLLEGNLSSPSLAPSPCTSFSGSLMPFQVHGVKRAEG